MEKDRRMSGIVLQGEIWEEVDGVPRRYFVSNYGRVKSYGTSRLLSPVRDRNGYFKINIDMKARYVHLLVAEHFLGYVPNKRRDFHVDHKDGDKGNNFLSNLQVITCRHNKVKSVNNLHSFPLISESRGLYTGRFGKNGVFIRTSSFITVKEAAEKVITLVKEHLAEDEKLIQYLDLKYQEVFSTV